MPENDSSDSRFSIRLDRVLAIIDSIRHKPKTLKELHQEHSQLNERTIRRDLNQLIQCGRVTKEEKFYVYRIKTNETES